MRILIWLLYLSSIAVASRSLYLEWPINKTFSEYLLENNASSVLRIISPEDTELVTEIQSGEHFYELRDGNRLIMALIPLGEEMQIEIIYDKHSGYKFDIVPIVYHIVHDAVSLSVGEGYYKQITHKTQNLRLAYTISDMFKSDAIFRRLRPHDMIAFDYRQKERLGRPMGHLNVRAALIKSRNKNFFAFMDKDGNILRGTHKRVSYTETHNRLFTYTTVRKVRTASFRMPVSHPRITSRFSYRRWHPILHKYRPHFGVDFGARRGTSLYAVKGGKIIYAGWMRGYGKVTKIDHGKGFVSLYAHQSKILVKKGARVKKGQIIGKVGSTGRSTGPHLHFGLYKRGKPVDPLKYIAKKGTGETKIIKTKHLGTKKVKVLKYKNIEIREAAAFKRKLEHIIMDPTKGNYVWVSSDRNSIKISEISPMTTQEEK